MVAQINFFNKIGGFRKSTFYKVRDYKKSFFTKIPQFIFINHKILRYLSYLNRRLDSMLQNHIHPVIIFDGDKLPMKKEEESDREK